ncbi:MAG: TIR domain-containing protein, partial [Rhodothermia bacterium]
MSGHDRVSIRFPRLFERDGRSARSRRVFISYRRAGGQAYAVAFLQGLTQVLGEGAVFLDVSRNALELGVPWRDSVRKAIDQSDTLLLVLDPGMASRLADPEDAVRFELEMAIRMGLRVLMVRVDDAVVTAATDLPESLVILPTLHSPAVHSDNAVADIERVIEDLTGRAPGEAKAIDGWDLVVLGTLTVVGVIAWAAKGVQLLNTDQTLLWGSVLLGPWLAWMSARRLIPLGSRSRTRRNFPQAAGWLAL